MDGVILSVRSFYGSRSERVLFAASFYFFYRAARLPTNWQITSNPPGATVELDGVVPVGTTPFEKTFPRLLPQNKNVHGLTLEHPVVERISLTGYASRETQAHRRPHGLDFAHGRNRRRILALQVRSFSRRLASRLGNVSGGITAKVSDGWRTFTRTLARRACPQAKPAVVY